MLECSQNNYYINLRGEILYELGENFFIIKFFNLVIKKNKNGECTAAISQFLKSN